MSARQRFWRTGIVVLLMILVVLGVSLLRLYVDGGLTGQAADSRDLVVRLGFLGGAICLVVSGIVRRRCGRSRGGKPSA